MKLTEKEQLARKRVCLPLDGLETLDEIKARIEELNPVAGLFKVGKESFTRFGPKIIELIHNFGAEVFLDLKYHDIPNTVKGAAAAAAQLGVYMFNVHATGGLEMLKAAKAGATEAASKYNLRLPKIIAVTILTSINQEILNTQLNVPGKIESQALSLARLTYKAGLDGIVCSAADLHALKHEFPKDFLFVTPGIKGPTTQAGSDQKRIFTPGNAIKNGSSILVVGRAITAHKTPEERLKAGLEILKDMVPYL